MGRNELMRMGMLGQGQWMRDYRVDLGPLKDITPSRAGRITAKLPGTQIGIYIPRAYIPLCKFRVPSPGDTPLRLHLVYFCCAIQGVDTYAWIKHKIGDTKQFDVVDIVFQCRGVVNKDEAEDVIRGIVSESGHPNVIISIYDDEPLSKSRASCFDDDCRAPVKECSCHDNYAGEYRGIAKAHEVAGMCEDHDIVTYWHSKGVSRYNSLEEYLASEKRGPGEVISTFGNIKHIFTVLPNLAIWSCFVGERSRPIPWFNMWSTRAGRLKALPSPMKTGKRHYYETYLGDLPLGPQEITVSPSPVLKNGHLDYILEVGYQTVRPDWWHRG